MFFILKILLGVDDPPPYRINAFLVNKSQLAVKYWLNLVTAEHVYSTVLFTSDKSAFLIVMATALLIAPSGTWSVLTEVGFPIEDGPSVIGVISDTKTIYLFHWCIFIKGKQQICALSLNVHIGYSHCLLLISLHSSFENWCCIKTTSISK